MSNSMPERLLNKAPLWSSYGKLYNTMYLLRKSRGICFYLKAIKRLTNICHCDHVPHGMRDYLSAVWFFSKLVRLLSYYGVKIMVSMFRRCSLPYLPLVPDTFTVNCDEMLLVIIRILSLTTGFILHVRLSACSHIDLFFITQSICIYSTSYSICFLFTYRSWS